MDFRKFLEMVADKDLTEAKKKKPDADGDGVPDWADKKPGKDDHADDKKSKKDKKKSLKDWIELVEKEYIAEAIPTGAKPLAVLDPANKQAGAAVVTSKNPTLQKMLGNLDPKEVQVVMTKTAGNASPTGTAQTSTPTAMHEEEVEESGLQAYLGKKKYGKKGMAALQKAGREGASKEKMAQIRAKHDKLDEVEKSNFWVHDQEENEYYGPYSSESSAREGGRVGPKAKIVKHPASVRNPRTLNRTATSQANAAKVKSAGAYGKAMEGQLDEKAVSKSQQKFMGMVHAAQKGEKAASPEVAKVAKSMKKGDVKDFAKTKHKGLPEKKKKTNEAEKPSDQTDMGAGLGAGRSNKVLEAKPDFLDLDKDGNKKESMKKAAADKKKKKVNESMHKNYKAAYHEGYTHGLREQPCRVKHYQDMEEAKQYYEGYKCGLDECYGMGQTAVIGETPNLPQSTSAMANAALSPVMHDMEEGNAFGKAVRAAKADGIQPGEKITVGGNTYPVKEMDAFAFESLDKQLEDLINEGKELVTEGLSVSMSTGQEGSPDSVSVTASDDDAGKLLAFIKQVGLGALGGQEAAMASHGTPAEVVTVSDYGAPKFSGSDDMAALMKKVGVDDQGDDYEPEGQSDHEHSDTCGCDKVDEVESADQRLYNVAEDDGEGYEQSQADAGKIDSALAVSGASKGGAFTEGGDGGEASEEPVMSEESKDEEDQHAEKAGREVAKDIEHDEGHKGKDDDKAEKAGEKVTKDIEYDDSKDAQEKKKVDEWANDAGKKGTDAAFEEDINFMTKVISGGLNKPKATGQTTIPVIAGQDARIGESVDDHEVVQWKRLAGLA